MSTGKPSKKKPTKRRREKSSSSAKNDTAQVIYFFLLFYFKFFYKEPINLNSDSFYPVTYLNLTNYKKLIVSNYFCKNKVKNSNSPILCVIKVFQDKF